MSALLPTLYTPATCTSSSISITKKLIQSNTSRRKRSFYYSTIKPYSTFISAPIKLDQRHITQLILIPNFIIQTIITQVQNNQNTLYIRITSDLNITIKNNMHTCERPPSRKLKPILIKT